MTSDYVETMEKSIGKDVAVFQKFLLDNNNKENTLFSFVEGNDFCYYNPRIRSNTSYSMYINYKCEGKKNVIGVKQLIDKNIEIKNGNSLLFFVDRDYNFEIVPKDIYVTDYYSIENFYLNETTLKKVIENIMELEIDSFNYNLTLKYFRKCYKIYSKFAIKLNAFYYTIREYEKINGCNRSDLNLISFSNFIKNNSIENFSMNTINFDILLKKYNIDYNIDKTIYNKNLLLFDEDNHYNFRGKFEIEFLRWFLFNIRKEIKNGTLNFKKEDVCKYDFNVDIMRILSEYAYTPNKLLKYICSTNINKLCNIPTSV